MSWKAITGTYWEYSTSPEIDDPYNSHNYFGKHATGIRTNSDGTQIYVYCRQLNKTSGAGYGELKVSLIPLVTDELLIWLKGTNTADDTAKLDSWAKPQAENFTMSGGSCCYVNGVDETGTTSANHGTIVSSEGTATIAYDGTTLSFSTAGTFYNVTFSDGTHYRLQENSGLISFSDDYEIDGHYITWDAIESGLWSQRQNSYFANATLGFWEIDTDPVLYPYPVVGFTTFHKGGTFNNCEVSYAPESFPIGTFNGDDDLFTMFTDHGTIVSYGGDGVAVPTYVHPDITFTAGVVRDILFSDGVLLPVDEGEGTDIHDSEGNIVGFADVTIPTFWEGEPMVAQSIIDAEAVQGSTVFTDGLGHPTPNTQQEWEASLIINNNKQYYLTNCNGLPNLLIYNRVLTSAEDGEVMVKGCLTEWVTVDGEVVTVDGEKVYVRI